LLVLYKDRNNKEESNLFRRGAIGSIGKVLRRAFIVKDLGLDREDNRVYKAGNSLRKRESL
jgi:hypothetical protein